METPYWYLFGAYKDLVAASVELELTALQRPLGNDSVERGGRARREGREKLDFAFVLVLNCLYFQMRLRISIRGSVRPSVRPYVRQSVGPSVGPSVRHAFLKTAKIAEI